VVLTTKLRHEISLSPRGEEKLHSEQAVCEAKKKDKARFNGGRFAIEDLLLSKERGRNEP